MGRFMSTSVLGSVFDSGKVLHVLNLQKATACAYSGGSHSIGFQVHALAS